METISLPLTSPLLDELTRLQFNVARRADELTRCATGDLGKRDFWEEAERYVWSRHLHGQPSMAESEAHILSGFTE